MARTSKKTTSKKPASKKATEKVTPKATTKQLVAGKIAAAPGVPDPAAFKVNGLVRSADGKAMAGLIVKAIDKDLRSEQLLGQAVTDSAGKYEISYTQAQFSRVEKKSADLIVSVSSPDVTVTIPGGKPVTTAGLKLATAPIIFNAQAVETVDLVVGKADSRGPSEFEKIDAELKPVLDGVPPAELTNEDIGFLAGETELNAQYISYFALAAKLSGQVDKLGVQFKILPQIFYGLVREDLPTELSALVAQSKQSLSRALEDAMRDNIISDIFKVKIKDTLDQLQQVSMKLAFVPSTTGKASLGDLLKTSNIPEAKLQEFVLKQVQHEGTPEEFWKGIRANPSLASLADKLQFTLQVGEVTQTHMPMVQQIQAIQGIKTLRDLANRDVNGWKQLINTKIKDGIVGFPPDTTGKNDEEKKDNYARSLTRYIEDRFPTEVIAARLGEKSDVAIYLKSNPKFDFRTTNVEKQFPQTNRSDFDSRLVTQLKSIQRAFNLAPRHSEMSALMAAGHDSAHSITRMGESDFVAKVVGPQLGAAQARTIYNRAAQVSAMAMQLMANYGSAFNRVGLSVLPPPTETLKEIPDWKTLFGSLELCDCEQCRSIHSAAAYLVDVLSFLDHRNLISIDPTTHAVTYKTKTAKDVLFARRPDLGEIELTCDNTNTPLPYIDLVNELLEDAVSLSVTPFVPPDLNRQTRGTAKELGANPAYLNVKAYDFLAQQVYPWTLPFDMWEQEAQIYLGQLGVKRHELMRVFQQQNPQPDPSEISVVGVKLGLTTTERKLLTGESPKTIAECWGFPPNAPLDSLSAVPEFLCRSGLSYAEMKELIKCKWINYLNNLAIKEKPPAPPDTCEIDKQVIANLDYLRVHRFVRLWRNLGWTMRELDQAFTALKPPSMHKPTVATASEVKQNEDFLAQLAQLQQLREDFGLPLVTLLSWYGQLDTAVYTDAASAPLKSLYEQLFQNPTVIKLKPGETDYFELNTDRNNLKVATYSFVANTTPPAVKAAISATLRAAFRINEDDLKLLIKGDQKLLITSVLKPDKKVSLDNLSRLYRTVTLSRALKLSITDFLLLSKLTAIWPFVENSSAMNVQATWRFIEMSRKVRESGWSLIDLDYLLNYQPESSSKIALTETEIGKILDGLRAELRKIADEYTLPTGTIEQPILDELLRKYLALIFDSESVDEAMRLLKNVGGDYTAAEEKFFKNILAKLVVEVPSNTRKASGDVVIEKWVPPTKEVLLDVTVKYLQRTISEELVKKQLSENLKLSETMAASLTDSVKSPADGARSAMTVFLSDAFINSDPKSALTSAAFAEQFNTFRLLHKIAAIISHYNITESQLKWLFSYAESAGWMNVNLLPAIPQPPGPTDSKITAKQSSISATVAATLPPPTFDQWARLNDLFALRDAMPNGEAALSEMFKLSRDVAALNELLKLWTDVKTTAQALLKSLGLLTGWDFSELEFLAGPDGFNLALPAAFQDERALAKLLDAMVLSRRLGMAAQQCRDLAKASLSETDARNIKHAVKAKYDDDQWLALAKPLRDKLREQQRAALVSYLVTHPDPDESKGRNWKDKNDLYSYFLIDVEMSPCQMTSRIKQAMSAVQLFVQRCLMNLEAEVMVNTKLQPEWLEWRWMKNYRVWEANRKVFLYPENWIEPELRDGKSPFFKDLENELMQHEVTADTAETALLNYLEKVDNVSRLDICGMYHEEESDDDGNRSVDILHVFGHTKGVPHIYYYRRRVDSAYWTPWEKVELDIEGDNLVPIVWNRRLRLFWLVLAEKKGVEGAADWKMKLAWSEYKNNKWVAKKISTQSFLAKEELNEKQGFYLKGIVPADDNGELQIRVFGTTASVSKTIDVPANDPPWTDTGVEVKKRIRISYRSGEWYAGYIRNTPPSNWYIDLKSKVNGSGYPAEVEKEPYSWLSSFKQFAGSSLGTLIGKIGEGNSFLVGNDYKGNPGKGSLKLSMNIKHPNYSGGSLTVEITEATDSLPLVDFRFSGCGSDPSVVQPSTGSFSPLLIPKRAYRASQEYKEEETDDGDDSLYLVATPATSSATSGREGANTTDVLLLNKTPGLYSLLDLHQESELTDQRPFFFQDDKKTFLIIPEITPSTSGVIGSSPTKSYRFHIFYHPYLCLFIRELNRYGVDGLFHRPLSDKPNLMLNPVKETALLEGEFQSTYGPNAALVATPYPVEDLDFSYGGAYSSYNWELFFHTPLLIATRLSQNQRFEDAQKWFHYIFDPTDTSDNSVPQKFWKPRPFFEKADTGYAKEQIQNLMDSLAKGNPEFENQVKEWREHPFKPHLIARMRDTAYQKTVVMKYIDNLIAWGDQLFSRDTIESINEATQLYILAAEILGRRPEKVKSPITPPVQTYNSIEKKLDGFSNALVNIENAVSVSSSIDVPSSFQRLSPIALPSTLYFCVPRNEKMMGYWDTVADRLFKIRHCMNIEGVERQLALFEPPIDPALLVKAAAAGLDIGSVLNDLNAPLPHYRFNVMSQKATELCGELKSLGGALLSALEKRDAEALSLLRSTHEINVLKAVRQVKEKQVEEARLTLEGVRKSLETVTARYQYYSSREFTNNFEAVQLDLTGKSLGAMTAQLGAEIIAAIMNLIPETAFGVSPSATFGGRNLAGAVQSFGGAMGVTASILNTTASLSGTMGGFQRRKDDWKHQADLASKELKQIEKQIAAAEIRLAISEHELENHDLQTENAKEVDDYMRNKFTNRELYDWMVSQISGIYFKSYQMAYDVAKRAERTYRFELGLEDSKFIQFGYWDSLKKGLLSGEQLYQDLKRMEVAYLDQNKREYELTKHISLAMLNPLALLTLKQTGECVVDLPEALFDMDYPGHYLRRIKSASLTIPCVTGPYTGINCTLTLLSNSVRRTTSITSTSNGYARITDGDDPRFADNVGAIQSIATSSAQNDSGVFELNFRDERYLPFEGAGAISRWRIELPKKYNAFDFDTISDVVLHLKYTARGGGESLKTAALSTLPKGGVQLLSLRHEFPSEWQSFISSPTSIEQDFKVTKDHFPFLYRNNTIKIDKVTPYTAPDPITPSPFSVTASAGPSPLTPSTLKLSTKVASSKDKLEDLWLLIEYSF